MGDDPRGMGRQVDAVEWTAGSDEVRALLPLPATRLSLCPSPRLIPTDSGQSQSPCGRIGLPGGPAERPSPRISLPPLQSVSLPRLPPSPSRRPCPQAETALHRAVGELLRTRKVHVDLANAPDGTGVLGWDVATPRQLLRADVHRVAAPALLPDAVGCVGQEKPWIPPSPDTPAGMPRSAFSV